MSAGKQLGPVDPDSDRGSLADGTELVLNIVSGVILVAMMALTFVDVFMRYLFSASIFGAFEITQILLITMIFAGLPLITRREEHVTMDLLDRWYGKVLARLAALFVNVICAAALGGAAWLLWRKAQQAAIDGDVTATLNLPVSPIIYVLLGLTAVGALIHVAKALTAATGREGQ